MADNVYQTDDYGRAAYLLLKDFNYIGTVGKKNVYKKFFIFEDSPELRVEADNWEHGLSKEAILCKKYFIKTRLIGRSLKEDVVDV